MRTFVAVELSNSEVLNSIKKIQTDLKIKARPVSVKNMHFTLLFLGEITEEVSNQVQDALGSIDFTPFDVNFVGVGAFPKPKFPRVIWVGTDDSGATQLVELAKKVEDALSPLGFHRDKPFKAHVTIFRIKNKIHDISAELADFTSLNVGVQKVSEIKFKKSVLTSNGPLYSDLQVVKAK